MDDSKYIVFRCGNEEYALLVDYVVSIEKIDNVNPIPQLPNYVRGLTNNRGNLLPVLDFEQILYGRFSTGDMSRLIHLSVEGFMFSLQVLEAKEILQLRAEDITQVGLVNYSRTRYFQGVANIDHRMITIISPEVLVNSLDGIKEIKQYMRELKMEQEA